MRTCGAWAMPQCWAHPTAHGAWARASAVGTPLHTRGAERLPQCWAHPLRTRGAWAPASVLGTPLLTRVTLAVCRCAGPKIDFGPAHAGPN